MRKRITSAAVSHAARQAELVWGIGTRLRTGARTRAAGEDMRNKDRLALRGVLGAVNKSEPPFGRLRAMSEAEWRAQASVGEHCNEQPLHDCRGSDSGSLGMTACARAAAVAALMLASLACARAQSSAGTYSIETGASLYASTAPHLAGHFSMLKDLGDAKTFSITSIEMRGSGSGSGQPVYTPMTGVARLVQSTGRISFWGLGQGGLAVSDSAVSGLINGGGAVAVRLTQQAQLVVAGQAVRAPALPQGWEPMLTIGLRLHAREQ